MKSNYQRAGIYDVSAFYASKFADTTNAARYLSNPLRRYDVAHSRSRWFDRAIRPQTTVLDFGCGAGSLSFLSSKGCRVFGIELSEDGAQRAREAGYEDVFVGDVADAPNWTPFDYVVSADVFGHIEFEDKDRVIVELKRLLKPEGIMLHAIECGAVDYDAMSDDEIREFVHVDGHVGMESRSSLLERFGKFFAHSDGEVRFIHSRAYNDMVKEASLYGADHGPELEAYLAYLGTGERLAFDVASGIAFNSLQTFRVPSDDRGGGMMMLRASDAPLRRPNLSFEVVAPPQPFAPGSHVDLDSPSFLSGWHGIEQQGSLSTRWSEPRAIFHAPVTPSVERIEIEFMSPETPAPTMVRFGQICGEGVLIPCGGKPEFYTAVIPRVRPEHHSAPYFWLQIETEYVHIPSWRSDSKDHRRLGICVKSIKFW
jgi:SAM-dependent methyltransferase